MSRRLRRLTTLVLVLGLVLALSMPLTACSGVQVHPKGEIVGGVSVGGRS